MVTNFRHILCFTHESKLPHTRDKMRITQYIIYKDYLVIRVTQTSEGVQSHVTYQFCTKKVNFTWYLVRVIDISGHMCSMWTCLGCFKPCCNYYADCLYRNIYTTVFSHIFIHSAKWTMIMWSEGTCPRYETAARGFKPRIYRLRIQCCNCFATTVHCLVFSISWLTWQM